MLLVVLELVVVARVVALEVDDDPAVVGDRDRVGEQAGAVGRHDRAVAAVAELVRGGVPVERAVAALAGAAGVEGVPAGGRVVADVLEVDVALAARDVGEEQGPVLGDGLRPVTRPGPAS